MYATSIAPFKNISSCSYKSHLISDTHKRWNVERHTGKKNLLLETHGRPIGSAAQEYIHQFYLYTHISAIQSIQDIISTCYPDSGITLKTKTFFLGVKHQECNKRPYSAISCLIALRLLVSYRRYCESVVSMNPSSAHTSMALKSEFYDITCDIESTLSDGSDMDEVYRAFVADSMEFFKRWTSDISCYASVDLLYESLEEHLRAGDEAMRYSWSVFVKGGQYYNDATTGGDRQIRMDSNTHISYQYDDVTDNTGVRLIDSVIEGIGFLFMRRVMIECECSNVPVDSNLPLYTVESPENADRMQKLKIFDFLERSLSKTLKERPGGLLGVLHDVVDIQRNNNEFTLGESTGSLAFWKRDVFCNLAQFAFTYCQKTKNL